MTSPQHAREIKDEILRRARQAAERYDVDQHAIQHYRTRYAEKSNHDLHGYIGCNAHAVLLELADAHTNCGMPACRVCELIREGTAQILATEQTDVDQQFADIAREAGRQRRWPWQRGKDGSR